MEHMIATGKDGETIAHELGFDKTENNDEELIRIAQSILDANPSIVAQYHGGKTTTIGFFVGQIMKQL